MMDYIDSKLAMQAHEERIRILIPVQEHDARLNDDRQLSIWPIQAGIAVRKYRQSGLLAKQARRLLSVGGLGKWMRQAADRT
jgi:hypothetical protein